MTSPSKRFKMFFANCNGSSGPSFFTAPIFETDTLAVLAAVRARWNV